VKDELWGARLHQADLAINKVLAGAGRSKARDVADLVAIGRDYCPLGPLGSQRPASRRISLQAEPSMN
jgi:hypothetical protein